MEKNIDVASFIQQKKDQCGKLIEYGIWKGIDSNNLKAWFKNFSTDQEKFFAACIIDWFVYRNDDHVDSMLFDLLTRHLHNQWRLDKNSAYDPHKNPLEILSSKWDVNKYHLRYVTAVRKTDKDTKSGFHIISVLNHNLGVSDKYNIRPDEVEKAYEQDGVRTFLFFDDIIGTGEQMAAVLQETRIMQYTDISIYVLVCAAHEVGVEELTKKFPRIRILYAEFIPKDSNFFQNIQYPIFEIKTPEEMHRWYLNFMKGKNVSSGNSCGRGDLGLLYAFNNNVPNNCLPILFYENESLSKLLKKRG